MVLLGYCRFDSDLTYFVGDVLTMGLAQVVFETLRTLMWYVAFEPYVRKIWPQTLITSSRLLEGRIRDPLVGRDVLVGAMTGSMATVAWRLNAIVQSHMGGNAWSGIPAVNNLLLSGTREIIATMFAAHGLAMFLATFVVLCLMICRLAFRTKTRASIAATLMLTAFTTSAITAIGGNWMITSIPAIVSAMLVLTLAVRFGFLAVLSFMTCRVLLDWFPLTLDTENWYFQTGMSAIFFISVCALIGVYLAVGNQSKVNTIGR